MYDIHAAGNLRIISCTSVTVRLLQQSRAELRTHVKAIPATQGTVRVYFRSIQTDEHKTKYISVF
jgi:hypothetical protein